MIRAIFTAIFLLAINVIHLPHASAQSPNPVNEYFAGKTYTSLNVSGDTLASQKRTSAKKSNVGGVFLAPAMGVTFPMGTFSDYSNSGFYYSFKLEIAHSKIYPFLPFAIYESHKNSGDPEFTNTNFLTQFDTEVTYYGGGVDFLLNKYIKSDFTMPVLSAEVKALNIKRTVAPDNLIPEIPREESTFAYSLGVAFTLYIFDVSGKYTFAGDNSSLNFNTRIHIPIFKF